MKRWQILSVLLVLGAVAAVPATLAQGMTKGKPQIQSMSALAFAPDGTLFVGDGKGGKIYAIDLGDGKKRGKNDAVQLKDVEGRARSRHCSERPRPR